MREIKFRAYVNTEKGMQMLYPVTFSIIDGQFRPLILYPDGASYSFHKVMQYTGLKDKNGKEIYEGDIVSFLGGNWMDDELTQKTGTVEWNEELLKFDVVTADKGAIPDLRKSYDDNKFEVIGNIYERNNQ